MATTELTVPAHRSAAEFPSSLIRIVSFVGAAVLLLDLGGLARGFVAPDGKTLFLIADDPMITLRIARNVAMGYGPYFNRGEHIAANTSLSLPFLLSPAFHFSTLSFSVYLLAILSMAIAMAAMLAVALFADSVPAAVLTLGSLALLPTMRVYASSTWEHVPQCLLVTVALCFLMGRRPWMGRRRYEGGLLLLSAAFWLRPDCLPLMLPPTLAILWHLRRRMDPAKLAALVVSLAAIAGYFVLQHHFYDSFMPNTYYLKVNFGLHSIAAGMIYLGRTIVDSSTLAAILALIVFFVLDRVRWSPAESLVLCGLVLQTLYIVAVGGDVFPCGRFFLLISPVVWMLFWEKALDLLRDRRRRLRFQTGCAVGLTLLFFLLAQIKLFADEHVATTNLPVYRDSFVTVQPDPQMEEVALSEYIQAHFSPNDGQVGLFFLGALSYYLPNFKIADFLGKADSVIAHGPVKWGPVGHNKWDIVHTLRDRNVAVIPFTPMPAAVAEDFLRHKRNFAFFAALQSSPYLHEHYTYFSPSRLGLAGPEGLYVRNDLIGKITPPTSDVNP